MTSGFLYATLGYIFEGEGKMKYVTLKQNSTDAVDKITVQWSEDIGVLNIDTRSNSSNLYTDYLTIKNANSTDFTFNKSSSNLVISSIIDPGCGIKISYWNSRQAFSNGITFDDGTVSFAEINQKAGF